MEYNVIYSLQKYKWRTYELRQACDRSYIILGQILKIILQIGPLNYMG